MFTLRTLFVLFKLLYTVETVAYMPIRVAEVARSREGLPRKVWTQTKVLSPYINMQICKFAMTGKNDEYVAKIANTRPTKNLWPFLHSLKGC